MWSAQEDPGIEDKKQLQDQAMDELRQDHAMTIQDLPRGDDNTTENAVKNDGGGDGNAAANALKNNNADCKGDDKRWWRKIKVLHVLGFVLVLALVGIGATLLYIVLL